MLKYEHKRNKQALAIIADEIVRTARIEKEHKMAKVINFNVKALALLGNNVQIRVREKEINGEKVLQVRPSARVLSTNLPEGETMRKLNFKSENGKVRGASVNVSDLGIEPGQAFETVKGKYGWLVLAPVAEVGKETAYGRVAAK
jgi:hypothetical protein